MQMVILLHQPGVFKAKLMARFNAMFSYPVSSIRSWFSPLKMLPLQFIHRLAIPHAVWSNNALALWHYSCWLSTMLKECNPQLCFLVSWLFVQWFFFACLPRIMFTTKQQFCEASRNLLLAPVLTLWYQPFWYHVKSSQFVDFVKHQMWPPWLFIWEYC